PQRQRAARVVVPPRRAKRDGARIRLPWRVLELVAGERARKILIVAHVAEVEAQRRAAAEVVPERRVAAMADLVAVVAIALQLEVREARVEVERPVDLPGREVILRVAEGSALAAEPEESFVVARLRHEVDRAAQREAAEAERARALVDLD